MKEDYYFSITSYKGHEDEVLNLRNNNRTTKRTREYMDWRYLGQQSSRPPEIFWVIDRDGNRVGMAALIFRPYWICNKVCDLGILGDISLNKELRGKGIANKLFLFLNSHIEKDTYPCALVIPNNAARKSLTSSGWKVQEELVHYVNILDPTEKIFQLLKIRSLSIAVGFIFKIFKIMFLLVHPVKELTVQEVEGLNKSVEYLWSSMDKHNIITRDRNIESMRWRYERHPTDDFNFVNILQRTKIIAHFVFLRHNDTIIIHDMLILADDYIFPAMIAFLKYIWKKKINSCRFILNESHPYTLYLKRAGFSKRNEDDIFQLFVSSNSDFIYDARWLLTAGDKDV